MFRRTCNISTERSFFLFGARGTGKTTFLNQTLPQNRTFSINLLLPSHYDQFSLNPENLLALVRQLPPATKWIFIDEVQKLPRLLDVVQVLMSETDKVFALTGSSSRKLKAKGVNLLAGRASVYNLYPFTAAELKESFSLPQALEWGTLPESIAARSSAARAEFLRSYAHTYLKEEIAQEQTVRLLEPFRKFLAVAAQANGTIVNFTKIARDCGVSSVTVKSYFQVLEDTLLGFFVESYHESVRKSQRQNPKFYFIDNGLERALSLALDVPLREGTYAYGAAFECFVINEIQRALTYSRKQFQLSYLRTKDDAEVDLIVQISGQAPILIEIKSGSRLQEQHCSRLSAFAKDIKHSRAVLISRDPIPKRFGAVECLPWLQLLEEIV